MRISHPGHPPTNFRDCVKNSFSFTPCFSLGSIMRISHPDHPPTNFLDCVKTHSHSPQALAWGQLGFGNPMNRFNGLPNRQLKNQFARKQKTVKTVVPLLRDLADPKLKHGVNENEF